MQFQAAGTECFVLRDQLPALHVADRATTPVVWSSAELTWCCALLTAVRTSISLLSHACMAMFVALAIQAEVRSQRYHKTKHLASHNRIFGNDGGLTSRTSAKVASQLLSARIFARVQTFLTFLLCALHEHGIWIFSFFPSVPSVVPSHRR